MNADPFDSYLMTRSYFSASELENRNSLSALLRPWRAASLKNEEISSLRANRKRVFHLSNASFA
ncbi:hypothetical protein E2C01_032865 [Portunus trituberculatus]|uniref:Uncharacterized protein n=1 Tax=Portunus trituberculatus TaxID=210409 RepID=A0A5B7EYK7_PORTR|nr:hypothetical protein [Portunus trituberculatus]